MEIVSDVDDFIAAPVGRAVMGDTWLYFCPRATLCGFTIWGTPVEAEIVRLTRALATELAPPAVPHASLVDVRRVEWIDPVGFAVLSDYVARNSVALSKMVTRLAIVRSQGYVGALAEGFFRVIEPPYPVRSFDDPAEAMTWLAPPGDPAFVAELERFLSKSTGVSPALRELRLLLDKEPGTLTLAHVAHQLAQSGRTLQRRLRELGTSFRHEVALSQVRVAMRLLLASDAKLERIAYDVGCSSQAHFSALFRRHAGDSPSSWRARHRLLKPAA